MHHLFITLLIASYERDLIHGLVRLGYMISSASDLTYLNGSGSGHFLALQISKPHLDEPLIATAIYGEVMGVLDGIGAKYHSIVITPFARDSLWAGGNIPIEAESRVLN